MMLSLLLPTLAGLFAHAVDAQQFAGTPINNTLQTTYGSEITYWNMPDAAGKNTTLINYSSLTNAGQRLDPSAIQRVLLFVHGNNRDPYNYMSYMLSALGQVQGHPEVNRSSVQLVAPYFPNGDDKGIGYPWNASAPAGGYGSYTNALVWSGAGWMNGTNNQYPNKQKTFSSYQILDTMIQYYDNKAMFPNVKQIVVGGHSAGAQTLHRYAAVGNKLNLKTPITYYIANPDSYLWLSDERPYDTSSCPTYDYWRSGLTAYTNTYGADLVASGRQNVIANYQSRSIRYARGTDDDGQDSSTCGAFMQGANRNERFFNFISAFPPECTPGGVCDTVDYVPIGHDAGGMMASPAGQARLFFDNWSGNGSMAYDMGCPRQQAGDDPFPDPQCGVTATPQDEGTYDGYKYMGCYTDTEYPSNALSHTAYVGWSNATIETCVAACSAAGYSIAGTEQGSYCFCDNSMFWQTMGPLPEAGCSVNCTGDATQICGDNQRISIFSLDGATPVVKPKPSSLSTYGGFSYEGCFNEVPGRALTGPFSFTNSLTVEMCVDFCTSKGYSVAGVEFATQCYCGNQLTFGANKTVDGLCNAPCGGNQMEFCGGSGVLNVYAVNSTFVLPTNSSSNTASPSAPASSTIAVSSTSTTSSISSTTTYPAATGALSCPSSDQQTFTTNGDTFVVECFTDRAGSDIAGQTPFVSTLEACIATCATTSGCVDVSWVPGTGSGVFACYLKSAVGLASTASNVWGARYIGASNSSFVYTTTASTTSTTSTSSISTVSSTSSSSSTTITSSSTLSSSTSSPISSPTSSTIPTPTSLQCPSANATTYTVASSTFEIECYVDRGTGFLAVKYVDTLNDCINWCANTTNCMDVSWSPAINSPCYLKADIGAPVANAGIWGAKLVKKDGKPVIVAPATTSSTALSVSTTSSMVEKASKSKSGKGSSTSASASASTSTSTSTSALTSSSTTSVSSTATSSSTSKSKGGNKPAKSSSVSSSSSSTASSSSISKSTSSSNTISSSSTGKAGKPGKASKSTTSTTSSPTQTTSSSSTSISTSTKSKGNNNGNGKPTTSSSSSSSSPTTSSAKGKPSKSKATSSSSTATTTSTTKGRPTKSIASHAADATSSPSTCTKDACLAAFKAHAKSASKVCKQYNAAPTAVVRQVDVLASACLDEGLTDKERKAEWGMKVSSVCGCLGGAKAKATGA